MLFERVLVFHFGIGVAFLLGDPVQSAFKTVQSILDRSQDLVQLLNRSLQMGPVFL